MREHPDWFIRDESGGPLRAGSNPDPATDEDKFAYALDASNPQFAVSNGCSKPSSTISVTIT
jgi:hypothetical protein